MKELDLLTLATLLDPRFKNKGFRQQERKKQALINLSKALQDVAEEKQSDPSPPKKVKPQISGLWKDLDKEVENSVSNERFPG